VTAAALSSSSLRLYPRPRSRYCRPPLVLSYESFHVFIAGLMIVIFSSAWHHCSPFCFLPVHRSAPIPSGLSSIVHLPCSFNTQIILRPRIRPASLSFILPPLLLVFLCGCCPKTSSDLFVAQEFVKRVRNAFPGPPFPLATLVFALLSL